MAASWKEAKDGAVREVPPRVYHDCDTGIYGACGLDDRQGSFRDGVFVEHRCICMPAYLSAEEPEAEEQKFLSGNPDG